MGRRTAAAGLVLLSCAGCSAWAGLPTDTPEPAGGSVTLSAQIRRQGDGGLRIAYTVINSTPAPVVLCDGIPAQDTTGPVEARADVGYVVRRPDGVLEVSRRTFAPPVDYQPQQPAVLGGQVVAPRRTVTGSVVVPAPVTRYQPYLPPEPLPPSDSAVFCVGVVNVQDLQPGLQQQATPVMAHPTRQAVLCTRPSPL